MPLAGAVQLTITLTASAVIVNDEPDAAQAELGSHPTRTLARAPEDIPGAEMSVTPTPRLGACQPSSGLGVARLLGRGADWVVRDGLPLEVVGGEGCGAG